MPRHALLIPEPLSRGEVTMKFVGLLLMPAGFLLTIAALVLFAEPVQQLGFVLSGLAVEALGLGVAVRGHMLERRKNRQ
jgi:hypothetical protein